MKSLTWWERVSEAALGMNILDTKRNVSYFRTFRRLIFLNYIV